jgi:hypothetical protein
MNVEDVDQSAVVGELAADLIQIARPAQRRAVGCRVRD